MPRVRLPLPDAGQVHLVQKILDGLHHATPKLESGTARDIMRSYGVTFEPLEGKIPAPRDVPASPPLPAAS